ncbi:hypothetical protein QOT17_021662 [Balamuthia mandrillaris]
MLNHWAFQILQFSFNIIHYVEGDLLSSNVLASAKTLIKRPSHLSSVSMLSLIAVDPIPLTTPSKDLAFYIKTFFTKTVPFMEQQKLLLQHLYTSGHEGAHSFFIKV